LSLRAEIEDTFQGKVFERPLFYVYHHGLRFELSEGGTPIEQFLSAHRKALTICQDIFVPNGNLVACLRFWNDGSLFAHRKFFRELRMAGVYPTKDRCIWAEPIEEDDRLDESKIEWWVNFAFRAPTTLLQNLLWCALVTDFGSISPNPGCLVYLFDINKKIAVMPYDDRGMDVVGEDLDLLLSLYRKHNRYLLDCDREAMDAKFANL
jgi:hypothetical protein